MYCNSYLLNLSNYLKHRGAAISQVSKLLSIVYEQIDRVFPNGLHDLYICSDVDLEFVRNLLYVTPKHIDPTRINSPKQSDYPDNAFGYEVYNKAKSLRAIERSKREFQATLFHSKSLWLYEQVRAEIHRRQQARITPEMIALNAIKNSLNQLNQVEMLKAMIEKKTKLVETEIDPADNMRISPKRLKDEEQQLKRLIKSLSDMHDFITEVDTDTAVIPSPPKPHKPYIPAVTSRTDKRSGKKWEKWVQMSLPENELPDTYDRVLCLKMWGIYQDSKATLWGKKTSAYPFDMYLSRDRQRSYEYVQGAKQEKLDSLQDWVNHELGLQISLQSLYTPKWSYVPPSVWGHLSYRTTNYYR